VQRRKPRQVALHSAPVDRNARAGRPAHAVPTPALRRAIARVESSPTGAGSRRPRLIPRTESESGALAHAFAKSTAVPAATELDLRLHLRSNVANECGNRKIAFFIAAIGIVRNLGTSKEFTVETPLWWDCIPRVRRVIS
jgi:hypothetical protein